MRNRRCQLTIDRLRELLDYNSTTGVFVWRVGNGRGRTGAVVRAGDIAGSRTSYGYLTIRVDGVAYQANRLAWLYHYCVWPEFDVDHRDTVPSHNWIGNLRDLPNALNRQNIRKARSDSKTGVQGVSSYKKTARFEAQIRVAGVTHYLGTFATIDDAHQAYLNAKATLHPAWVAPPGSHCVRTQWNQQGERRMRCDCKSGIPGVSLHTSGRWIARAYKKHLGMFDTPEQARAAVVKSRAREEN